MSFFRPGPNHMADALVTADFTGRRHLLMVERGDGLGWAVPGGRIEPGETDEQAAVRELGEETGLDLTGHPGQVLPRRRVPDPRETAEAWAVTTPVLFSLGTVPVLPQVKGDDDARAAAWIPAASWDALHGALGGAVFAAHVPMLRDFLGGAA